MCVCELGMASEPETRVRIRICRVRIRLIRAVTRSSQIILNLGHFGTGILVVMVSLGETLPIPGYNL